MINTVSASEAARWLASGEAVLIDVREADEFSAEHIAYANSLPLSNLQDLFRQMDIPANRKIIIHCLKGERGGQACLSIQGCGTCRNTLYNMEGGITAWKDAGLPVISSAAASGISIFRQVQIIVGGLIAMLVLLGLLGIGLGFVIAGFLGVALFIAGLTGWCGLAMLLSKMPWNKNR